MCASTSWCLTAPTASNSWPGDGRTGFPKKHAAFLCSQRACKHMPGLVDVCIQSNTVQAYFQEKGPNSAGCSSRSVVKHPCGFKARTCLGGCFLQPVGLCRVLDALHLAAPCCTQQQHQQPAATSAPASSSVPMTSSLHSAQPSTSTPTLGEASTLPPLELDAFLTAAHCEAQLVQMLLDSQAATGSESDEAAATAVQHSREQHVLDAVVRTDGQGHSHCLQGAACWADACVNAEQTVLCGPHAHQMKRLILSRCPSLQPTVVLVQLLVLTQQPSTLCVSAVLPQANLHASQHGRVRVQQRNGAGT